MSHAGGTTPRDAGASATPRSRGEQILAFRRRVGPLDERMPKAPGPCDGRRWPACRTACRGRRCSPCTRASTASPSTWEHPRSHSSGARYSSYVVPKRDFALFSLGRLPDNAKGRHRAERMAAAAPRPSRRRQMTDREALAHSASATRSGTPRRPARWRSAGRARVRRRSGRSPRPGSTRPTPARARSTLSPRLRARDR